MVLIKEYRVVLPITVEEHQIGQLYAVAQASHEETGPDSAVEILVNEPYDDPVMGRGQYTHKIYHIGGRVPKLIKALAPASAMAIEEKAWNSYPYCKTVMTNQFLGDRLSVIVESRHLDDRGTSDNVHNLPPEILKQRQVHYIDIGTDQATDPKYMESEYNPATFKSEKTGRGPLIGNWRELCSPVMCCYKLVTVKFKVFGLESRVESFIEKTQFNLFIKFHKQLFCLIDKWFGLTLNDIRQLEKDTKEQLDKKLDQLALETRESKSMGSIPSIQAVQAMENTSLSPAPSM